VVGDSLEVAAVCADAAAGLNAWEGLPAGGALVRRDGHVFTRNSVSFHAPDSELHGVLSRQREIEELTVAMEADRAAIDGLRREAKTMEGDIEQRRAALEDVRTQIDAQRQLHHALQLEAVRLGEQSERIAQRGHQITEELPGIELQLAATTTHRER